MRLPTIWGKGSIFAFSGLEGENTFNASLTGTLCGDKIGVTFNTEYRRELFFHLNHVKDIEYKIVSSDFIHAMVTQNSTNIKMPLAIAFLSQDTVIGCGNPCAVPVLSCQLEKEDHISYKDGIEVHSCGQEHTAFMKEEASGITRFAFSFSRISGEDAIDKIHKAMDADLDGLMKKKMDFFEKIPQLEGLEGNIEETLYKCFSIMKSQIYSPEGLIKTRWTTPDRIPHKKIWLWDSVFHSFGNRYISEEIAYESIKAVLCTQREDGFIPHMFQPPDIRSEVTQPPVLAWGVYSLYTYTNKIEILQETYQSIKNYLVWNMENRDGNRNDLYEWVVQKNSIHCRCDECGMDNSPRFDHVTEMDCIDFSCFMANEARTMAKIAEILNMKDQQEYWESLYERIKNAVNRELWDEEDGFYYDRILENRQLKKVKAVSSFLPLFAGICEKNHAERLIGHLKDNNSFNTVFPIPSISIDDPTFGTDMWRGPVWINYNYMIALGLKEYGYKELADEIIRKTLEVMSFWYMHDGVIYEFYDCMDRVSPSRLNRKGPCIEPYDFRIRMQAIRDYGWSATLFAAMVFEKNK